MAKLMQWLLRPPEVPDIGCAVGTPRSDNVGVERMECYVSHVISGTFILHGEPFSGAEVPSPDDSPCVADDP